MPLKALKPGTRVNVRCDNGETYAARVLPWRKYMGPPESVPFGVVPVLEIGNPNARGLMIHCANFAPAR